MITFPLNIVTMFDDPTVLDRTQAGFVCSVILGSQSLEINTPRVFIVRKHRQLARAHTEVLYDRTLNLPIEGRVYCAK